MEDHSLHAAYLVSAIDVAASVAVNAALKSMWRGKEKKFQVVLFCV